MADLLSIILAAGDGTRMRSAMPKVLHPVGGLSMVGHTIRTVQAAGSSSIAVVVGPGHDAVAETVASMAPEATMFEQSQRLGTAHAVKQARAAYETAQGNVLVLYADTPLVTPATIAGITARLDAGADVVVVGFEPEDPTGYGRLLTEGGKLLAIREHRDASEAEREIGLVNSGIIGFKGKALRAVIERIGNRNAKGEFYLTDAVELANQDKMQVAYTKADAREVIGVDDRRKLAEAETQFQELRRDDFMKAGVTLKDPSSVYFSYDTEIGPDTLIEPNVVFGPGVKIGQGVKVFAFSHIAETTLGDRVEVGPFVRLRGKTVLAEDVHLGNFVEAKNARIGVGTKAMHLSYLGDTVIGSKTNVGAGTITCNYDGVNKTQTTIGDNVFVGSNSSLVAPVSVGDRAYIGSGSVITEDVPADALAFGRARQENKPGYAPKLREKAMAKKAAKGKS